MNRVAIVGANGFIGSRAVEVLHLGGHAEVRPVVRAFASMARPARFDLDVRIADALDREALAEAVAGCDVMVHALAGEIAAIPTAALRAYEACEAAGVRRLVYLSSASVHGQAPAEGTDERSPLSDDQPIPYNNARVRAERALVAARGRGATELVMLRPSIVFGPRSSWVVDLAEAVLAGNAYFVGDGRGVCNSIYVDNLIHAIVLAAGAQGADGEAFLVSDAERVTWEDFARPIAEALGGSVDAFARVDPPGADRARRGVLRSALAFPAVRAGVSVLPRRVRASARAAVDAWRANDAAAPRPGPSIEVTLETALLHRCTVKLPSDKAAAVLGYAPLVTFDEACRRTVGWLAYAGYGSAKGGRRVG
jgi:nucleoside-diphosphate-sugar epimerase